MDLKLVVPVTLAVVVLELLMLRELLGEPVDVFDEETVCVGVVVTMAVLEGRVVFV